jgi:hypothetical protein
MRQHRRLVFRIFPYRQKPAMDFWVQGFHPPIQEFGKPGQIGDIADRQTGIGKRRSRAPSRCKLNTKAGETARETGEAGLIGNGKQCAGSAAKVSLHRYFRVKAF